MVSTSSSGRMAASNARLPSRGRGMRYEGRPPYRRIHSRFSPTVMDKNVDASSMAFFGCFSPRSCCCFHQSLLPSAFSCCAPSLLLLLLALSAPVVACSHCCCSRSSRKCGAVRVRLLSAPRCSRPLTHRAS